MSDSLVAVALLGAFSLAFVGSTDAGERHGLDLGILEQLDTRRDSPVIQPSRAGLAAFETRKCLDALLAPATTGTCAYEVVPAAASGGHPIVVAQAQDGASAADADAGLAGQSADELARQSSNPLGGDFWILLNQFDNYFMQGDITDDTRNINTWAFQPVVPMGLGGD